MPPNPHPPPPSPHTHILTFLTPSQEELADWEEKAKSLSRDELGKVIVIRIFTNLFTILLLGGGGVAIFYAAQLSFTTVQYNYLTLVTRGLFCNQNSFLSFRGNRFCSCAFYCGSVNI